MKGLFFCIKLQNI